MIKNYHGGDIYSHDIKYDFSANINPLGMPLSVKNALINHVDDFEHYPDVNCTKLRKKLSELEHVKAENIICGNGAADLIYRIAQTLKPKTALLPVPTFSEYEKALLNVGCKVKHYLLDEKYDFKLDYGILEKLCGIDMIFLCNPNNPVGSVIDNRLMKLIIEKCVENHIYLVIDECFMDFVHDKENYSVHTDKSNVIILKAFTKIYAMAGLRLGYVLCSDTKLAERIQNCGQCWNVSVPAQIAGIAALQEKGYTSRTVELITDERRYLTCAMQKFGFKVYPSKANFILFKCSLPIYEILLSEQILIRSCDNYIGLDGGYFRIAVRTHPENEALINAIEGIMKNG